MTDRELRLRQRIDDLTDRLESAEAEADLVRAVYAEADATKARLRADLADVRASRKMWRDRAMAAEAMAYPVIERQRKRRVAA